MNNEKDNDMFMYHDSDICNLDNNADVENNFWKGNSVMDYDLKLDEFVLDKNENVKQRMQEELTKKNLKIFNIDKEERNKNIQQTNKNMNANDSSSERINENSNSLSPNYPTASSIDHTSISNKIESKENIDNEESCTSEENSESLYNHNSCAQSHKNLSYNHNGANICNINNCKCLLINYNDLTITERMKFKREKTKMLLEKKTKRHNEESSFSRTCLNETKATNFSNINGSLNVNEILINDLTCNTVQQNTITKKDIKMLRNRISAQRSRDRKKKEMDELKLISQNLINETLNLKQQLDIKDRELMLLKEKLSKICKKCTGIVNEVEINQEKNKKYQLVEVSRRNFTTNLKYSLMTGFLVIVCFLGVFSIFNNSNIKEENSLSLSPRILKSVESSNIDEESESTSAKSGSFKTSENSYNLTELIPFENQVYNGKSLEIYNKGKGSPFSIVKDFTKKTNRMREEQFLGKKRMEFNLKMNNKNKKTKIGGFLQKKIEKEELCVNTEGLQWSIQEEIQLNDDSIQNDKSIIHKSNHEQNNEDQNYIVPFKSQHNASDKMLLNSLNENIKSLYCRDFITTAEENTNMFNSLFKKLNLKMQEELLGKKYIYF